MHGQYYLVTGVHQEIRILGAEFSDLEQNVSLSLHKLALLVNIKWKINSIYGFPFYSLVRTV